MRIPTASSSTPSSRMSGLAQGGPLPVFGNPGPLPEPDGVVFGVVPVGVPESLVSVEIACGVLVRFTVGVLVSTIVLVGTIVLVSTTVSVAPGCGVSVKLGTAVLLGGCVGCGGMVLLGG